MAAKLVQFYDQATKDFGGQGRVKLAMLTKIPSSKAAEVEDSTENIRLFEKALAQLRLQVGA